MIFKDSDPKLCFYLNQKYNKGRYNNIHGTTDDINLYFVQKNILKPRFFWTKYKLLQINLMAAILDSQNTLEVVAWLIIVQFRV